MSISTYTCNTERERERKRERENMHFLCSIMCTCARMCVCACSMCIYIYIHMRYRDACSACMGVHFAALQYDLQCAWEFVLFVLFVHEELRHQFLLSIESHADA